MVLGGNFDHEKLTLFNLLDHRALHVFELFLTLLQCFRVKLQQCRGETSQKAEMEDTFGLTEAAVYVAAEAGAVAGDVAGAAAVFCTFLNRSCLAFFFSA